MQTLAPLLKKALQENAYETSDTVLKQFSAYLALLQTWNRVFNLTNITEPRDMVYLHIIDSLAVAPYLAGLSCLDVGSGAGLPGIPLAIWQPEQQWMLLDKNSKKTRFLTQTIAELQLTNVGVVHSRSEDFHPAQGFDSILSRAFGTIRMFVETTEHLLNPNGTFIAMKGRYPEEELNDIPDRFLVQDVARLEVKGIDIERHVVRLRMKN